MPRAQRKKPFERDVSSARGAPMGRPSDPLEEFSPPVHLERVLMVDGDYDAGGAYWGGGGSPVFCVWDNDGHAAYFRARDSNAARAELPPSWRIVSASKKRGLTAEDEEILRGMARGPWAIQWANEQEEAGESFSGQDIYEAAPEAPRWTKKWARDLADAITSANGIASLEELYQAAVSDGFAKDRETFGYYLGMQAQGHGVSWDDDHSADLVIRVPSMELYEGARPNLRFMK